MIIYPLVLHGAFHVDQYNVLLQWRAVPPPLSHQSPASGVVRLRIAYFLSRISHLFRLFGPHLRQIPWRLSPNTTRLLFCRCSSSNVIYNVALYLKGSSTIFHEKEKDRIHEILFKTRKSCVHSNILCRNINKVTLRVV